MTCPVCRAIIPDNLLSCPVCMLARNDRALLEAQHAYFAHVLAGFWQFLTFRTSDGVKHIRIFGGDKSFCGQPIVTDRRKIGTESWGDGELKFICAGCRIEVRRIMEGVAAHPV